MLTISVLKESVVGEKRVALVPESVKRLAKQGISILVQEGAGVEAGFRPSDYEAAGAAIVSNYDELKYLQQKNDIDDQLRRID